MSGSCLPTVIPGETTDATRSVKAGATHRAAPAKTRLIAHDVLAHNILRWWYSEADQRTRAATLIENALDPIAFERIIHRVRTAMPSLDILTKDWLAQASKVLNDNPPSQGLVRTEVRFQSPPNKANVIARKVAGLPATYPSATGLPRISTVYQVKGDEAEAVFVCLPKVDKRKVGSGEDKATAVMGEWLQAKDMDSEAIRVLYVAATRARRLLAIAVPAEFKIQAADYLKSLGLAVTER